MKKTLGIIGFVAFAIGLIMAIICGFVAPQNDIVILILVILGIIIGLLNISSKEVIPLLLATIALVVVGGAFDPIKTLGIGKLLSSILALIATLMAPAAVIAAIKALIVVGFPEKES